MLGQKVGVAVEHSSFAHEQRDGVIEVNSQADKHQGQWFYHRNKRPKT